MKSHRKLHHFEVIKVKHCIFLNENADLYLSAFKNADSSTYMNKSNYCKWLNVNCCKKTFLKNKPLYNFWNKN